MSEGDERLLEVPRAALNPLPECHRQLHVDAPRDAQFADHEVANLEDEVVEARQGSGVIGARVEVMHVHVFKAPILRQQT